MNSYVFAYFVDKSNNTYIFEDNQNDLEAAIERLSGYLEQELALKNVTDLRQKLMDCYM